MYCHGQTVSLERQQNSEHQAERRHPLREPLCGPGTEAWLRPGRSSLRTSVQVLSANVGVSALQSTTNVLSDGNSACNRTVPRTFQVRRHGPHALRAVDRTPLIEGPAAASSSPIFRKLRRFPVSGFPAPCSGSYNFFRITANFMGDERNFLLKPPRRPASLFGGSPFALLKRLQFRSLFARPLTVRLRSRKRPDRANRQAASPSGHRQSVWRTATLARRTAASAGLR